MLLEGQPFKNLCGCRGRLLISLGFERVFSRERDYRGKNNGNYSVSVRFIFYFEKNCTKRIKNRIKMMKREVNIEKCRNEAYLSALNESVFRIRWIAYLIIGKVFIHDKKHMKFFLRVMQNISNNFQS